MSIGSRRDVRRTTDRAASSSWFIFPAEPRGRGRNDEQHGGLGILMTKHTVAVAVFPSATSPRRVNPNTNFYSSHASSGRCFPSDLHKSSLFLFPGLSIPQRSEVALVSGQSCHDKSKHSTAIRAWWKPTEEGGGGGGLRRRLHRRLVITLSKDLLSICWCARERLLTPCDWITGVARGALEKRGQARPEAHGHAWDRCSNVSCVAKHVGWLQLLAF